MDRSEHEPLKTEQPKGETRVCYFEQAELHVAAIVGTGDESGDTWNVWMVCPECGQQYFETASFGESSPPPVNHA